jgi:hypothetical protein
MNKEEYKNDFILEWKLDTWEKEKRLNVTMKSFTKYGDMGWVESGEFSAILCEDKKTALITGMDNYADNFAYLGLNKKDVASLINNLKRLYKEMK